MVLVQAFTSAGLADFCRYEWYVQADCRDPV